jgi:2-polyprenyl-3-methyl-5-hydroxy-6-metoxy-1,4-benzoquinol methylase
MTPSLATRYLIPELMDDPNLDRKQHETALAGLRRVNQICFTSRYLAQAISRLASDRELESVEVLDVGCGSGDIAVEVARQVSLQVPCRVTGWDISSVAIETATATASKRNREIQGRRFPNVLFQQRDILDTLKESSTNHSFDVIYCSLFLHHFEHDHAVAILKSMRQRARHAIVVDDLCRSNLGWLMAYVGCRLLTRSPIVHFDGPQSVRAAYTLAELKELADQAGLSHVKIRKHWPERFLMVSEQPK